jgi:hypothetical protein
MNVLFCRLHVLVIHMACCNESLIPKHFQISSQQKYLKLLKHEKHSNVNSDQGISHGGRPSSELLVLLIPVRS